MASFTLLTIFGGLSWLVFLQLLRFANTHLWIPFFSDKPPSFTVWESVITAIPTYAALAAVASISSSERWWSKYFCFMLGVIAAILVKSYLQTHDLSLGLGILHRAAFITVAATSLTIIYFLRRYSRWART